MAELLLAILAALIAGGCTALLAVIVARVIAEGRVHPGARDAVLAALDEADEWEPYHCRCGDPVADPEDARTVGADIWRERVCPVCYDAEYGDSDAIDSYDDTRLHQALDGGVRL